jgi:hypothetical protein
LATGWRVVRLARLLAAVGPSGEAGLGWLRSVMGIGENDQQKFSMNACDGTGLIFVNAL